jgi:RNA recognition motif-containing protein
MSEGVDTTSLILKLLFSGYGSPKESRFVKYFYSNKIEQKKNPTKRSQKSLNIEPEDIINGKDKRTTIILKNLPNDISKEELKSIIEPLGNINFIYIPLLIKNKNKHNLPCAYLNVINYKTILKIVEKFNEIKNLNQLYNAKDLLNVEIFYSGTQGKHALINRFSLEKKYLPPNQEISFY